MGPAKLLLENALFDRLVQLALNDERCPFNDQLPGAHLQNLARGGRVRIEVFRRNWRVVTILEGEHAGKTTKRDTSLPPGSKPYKMIDGSSGPARTSIPTENRRAPWKPGTPRL